jgi:hypothetical protein
MRAHLRGDLRSLRPATELARLHCDTGRFDEAAAVLTDAGDGRHFEDSRGTAVRRLAVDARIAAHEGRHAEALDLSRQALDRANARDGDLNLRAGVLAAYAEVLRAGGRSVEADGMIDKARELYERKGNVAAAGSL